MDLLNQILSQKKGDLLGALGGLDGFPTDKAEAFLPEAMRSVTDAMVSRISELDAGDLASNANVGTLLKEIDVTGLAGRVGVSAEQGSLGLRTLLPMVLAFVSDQGDAKGLLGMFGKAGGLGDALGGLGKMFGR